ncbi:hypothetical protein [Spiroplasma endosymbiont of Lasioglossum malachurum]|uniref:hypothetical protein n=1 Tax=Spiroplasma endosymbiont of Lasioglossum malachurum TaxID=3066319 RepID=UPI0030D3918C
MFNIEILQNFTKAKLKKSKNINFKDNEKIIQINTEIKKIHDLIEFNNKIIEKENNKKQPNEHDLKIYKRMCNVWEQKIEELSIKRNKEQEKYEMIDWEIIDFSEFEQPCISSGQINIIQI